MHCMMGRGGNHTYRPNHTLKSIAFMIRDIATHVCTDFITQTPAPSENRLLYYALAAGYFISILNYTFPFRNTMHQRMCKLLSGKSASRQNTTETEKRKKQH